MWRYRRVKGQPWKAAVGDISLQNWEKGNDYPYQYLFKNKTETLAEVADWHGGVDINTLKEAELHALGWYYNFKE